MPYLSLHRIRSNAMKEVLYPDLSQVRLEVGVVKLADVSSSFGLNDNKSSHIADKMRLSLHSYQK